MSMRLLFLVALAVAGCHPHGDFIPLTKQTIYFSDKFYDVKALGPERALIAGYGGKLLETTDAGLSFTQLDTKTDLALYDIAVAGDKMWISGQQGLILHSADGGKIWQKQDSGTENYLFAIYFWDANHGISVGDRSTLTETSDGGKTWKARTIPRSFDDVDPDLALAMQDPIFYDIRFVDESTGWIAGEFGRLLKTTDGGKNWIEQQSTLMTPESGIVDPMDIPTFFGIFPINEQRVYAAGLDGSIARTENGGELWTFEKMDLSFPIVDPLYRAVFTPDGTGWAVGAAGEIVTRKVGDDAWTRADLGMPIYTWIRAIDFADAKNGWLVGGYGTILRTDDGGQSWRMSLG